MSGLYVANITVPGSPNNTVEGVASAINNLGWASLSAEVRSGKLCIFSNQILISGTPNGYLTLSNAGSGTALNDLGIDSGNYFQPFVSYGTSAQMPLWTSSQTAPRPTGSVWIKVGSAGNGLNPIVAVYNTATASWINKNVTSAVSDWSVTSTLDATGGQAIPAGTIYGQYQFNSGSRTSPYYLWERIATGPTVITGDNATPDFTAGTYYMNVYVSIPEAQV